MKRICAFLFRENLQAIVAQNFTLHIQISSQSAFVFVERYI